MSWTLVGSAAVSVGSWALNKYAGPKKKGGGGGGQAIPADFDPRNPDQKRVEGALADFVTKYLPDYEPGKPYEGDLSAQISPYETQGLSFLQKALDQPDQSGLMEIAQKQVMDTLQGKFDPRTSEYYRAMREEAELNRRDAIDQTRLGLGARNKFFASERIAEEGDINLRHNTFLNRMLAEMAEKERVRALGTVPIAQELDLYNRSVPLLKAESAMKLGALPRELDQSGLDRMYQEFVRQRKESALPLVSAGSFGNSPTMEFTPYQPAQQSGVSSFLNPLLKSAGSGVIKALPGIIQAVGGMFGRGRGTIGSFGTSSSVPTTASTPVSAYSTYS